MIHPDNEILFNTKEISYQVMKRHGGNLDACYKVKEAKHKKSHTVWFHLCGTSKIETESRLVVARSGGR